LVIVEQVFGNRQVNHKSGRSRLRLDIHESVLWTLQEVFDGELISSVKMSSVNALAIARSSRVSNWFKVSPRRRTSMAKQLCPSVAVATQPMGRSTPTVISPSAISSAIFGRNKEVTAEFFPAAF
jgi:hypothetical protein